MRRSAFAAVVALAAIGLWLPALAHADHWGGPNHWGGPRKGMGHGPGGQDTAALVQLLEQNAAQLKLEPSVLEQIRAVADHDRQATSGLVQRMDTERETMRNLLAAPVPDESAVMSQAEVLGGIDTELHKQRLSSLIEIRRLLTPDQIAQLGKIQEQWRQQHQGPGRHRHGREGAPDSQPSAPANP
jgi:Spy/CpxP family protein refolding chaperone